MKETLKGISFVTILLLFLYISGSLYLIGFWSTFDLDISGLISITDIPKFFIYPLIISQAATIVVSGISIFLPDIMRRTGNRDFTNVEYNKMVKNQNYYTSIIGIVVIISIFVLYFIFNKTESYWFFSCFLLGLLVAFRLTWVKGFEKIIPIIYLRWYFTNTICCLLAFSLATGKIKGLDVYYNKDTKYIKIINPKIIQNIADTTSLKLLGFLGDKFIVSSLDNKRILVLNQSACDGIELRKKEDK